MKNTLTLAKVGLLALSGATLSATTVYTNPVGYMTATINADDSGNGRFSAVGFPLLNPIVAAGVVESNTASSITDSSLTWAPSTLLNDLDPQESMYYMTIKSGPNEGRNLDIVSVSGSTIVLDSNEVDTYAGPDATYEVRSYRTLGDVFGSDDSSISLKPGNVNEGDLVYLVTGGAIEVFHYLPYSETIVIPGFPPEIVEAGWRKSSDSLSELYNDKILPSNEGILVLKRDANPVDVVAVGDVKVGRATKDVSTSFSIHTYDFPVDTTIDDLGLYEDGITGFKPGVPGVGDLLYLVSGDGAIETYYYLEYSETIVIPGFPPEIIEAGWRKSTDSNLDNLYSDTLVSPGDAFLVYRQPSEGSFEWSADQPF
ncbi:MAG: TIGR02597 family protein [Opitutales bacterium]